MKKLLVLLALYMVLAVVLVACDTPGRPVDETTEGTTEAPTTEEPTTEEPTTEEPTTEEPTTEEPTTEAPTTEEPTTEEPTTEEPTTEEPAAPDHSYRVNLSGVTVTGSYQNIWPGDGLATTPALGATDSMIVLHYGSINLGEVDLSKYSKVTVTYGNMAGAYEVNGTVGNYDDEYNATQKRVMLTNTASGIQDGTAFELTPADDAIIAFTNYEKSDASLVLRTVEIDLTEVTYNGQTYLTFDFRNAEGAFGYVANLLVITDIVFE